jgi:acyl-CoA thioesterase
MTTAYQRATALENGVKGRIDPSWYQGRGAFGGLLAALSLGSMRARVADEARTPRSLTVQFCAPAREGPFEITTELLRVGGRITSATARLVQEGKTTTFATASFCRAREPEAAPRYLAAEMPDVERPSALHAVRADLPGAPAFFAHVEARFCGPVMPFSGATLASVAAWVRLREPAPYDAGVAALLIDALPPAVTSTFTSPRPLVSVDFRIDLLETFPLAGLAADDSLLVSITSRWADDGYVEELRDLWTSDGRLVAQCRQLLALL